MRRTVKKTTKKKALVTPDTATVSAPAGVDKRYIRYVRDKVNQLLQVMGTFPLKPEELDDDTLLDLDPIGIIAGSFEQVLDHLRETNRELTIARDELQAIFDATGVGISIIDTDFRILKCNEKQRALLVDGGIKDVSGRYCYEIYCKKESPGLDCPAVDTLATGRSVIVREVEKKGKHFQIATTPFKDAKGNTMGVIEVLLDITEMKKAKDAEREQRGFYLAEKSKLAAVIQSLSDGLFVTDSEGRIGSFNNAASKITGYAEAEVLGRTYREFLSLLSVPPNDSPVESAPAGAEFSITARDKRRLIISIHSVLLNDGDGKSGGRVFTFRDVTEEKQRQEVYYRTEKMVALGQLSAGIAHELNTPLGSILGYARLLAGSNALPPQDRERLDIIAEQAKRGSVIIKGLLNFARQSNQSLKDAKDTDVSAVIGDAIRVLATEARKRAIALTTDLHAVTAIKADRRQLEQVIINMILNALQAIREGGEVRICTLVDADELKILIEDNGPGIPKEIRTKIFDPFFTTKPVGEGTGLGLSICAGIISEHGGSINVESEEGKGATFIISLPLPGEGR